MKRRLYIIISILVVLLMPQHLEAQDNNTLRQVYTQAEEEYQVGRLEQALELLQSNISHFEGNLKQNAYRLISLCYLAQDDITQSENYAKLLLQENPYYTSIQDPIRFEEMIAGLKMGQSATITTASNQAERIEEAPVPVTLITEDMITMSGARNLKELLIAYVPGMTNVECNEEMNIAMRGIYSSGQEKILIMMDGHRLNSYATNVARPDFSISLEKVKQVEVLRGPASSLYGGVALTAVINIITKRGSDIDGFRVKGGIGSYGQIQGSVLFGKQYMDFDVMGWANIYNAKGEHINIPIEEQRGVIPIPGDIIIGGYNKKPSYDVGTRISWKNFKLMHITNFSKYVAPYSLSYFFAPYQYEAYRTFDGNMPGFANTAHHTSLSYQQQLGAVNLIAKIGYDTERQTRYQVASDFIPEELEYIVTPIGTNEKVLFTEGVFQYHTWYEETLWSSLQSNWHYKNGEDHDGTLTAGIQYNYFNLEDSYYLEGHHFRDVVITFGDDKNLGVGSENFMNIFAQLKHRWKNLILNAGLRYDYKKRFNHDIIQELSPRVALIYLHPLLNMKLSYSKAFVDAPYFYRNNTLDTTTGGENLLSEYLHSWQLSLSTDKLLHHVDAELNVFYNKATNLVVPDGLVYTNSGILKNIGAECNLTYRNKNLNIMANATWQHVVDFESYSAEGHSVYNIPKLSASIVASYRFSNHWDVHTNIRYTDKQLSSYQMPGEEGFIIETLHLPSVFTCNLGVKYNYQWLTLSAEAYNIFNKKYEQGGTSIAPIAQQGRWLLTSVALNF